MNGRERQDQSGFLDRKAGMQQAKLLVCEPVPNWVAAIRWSWPCDSEPFVEAANLADCRRHLASHPASLLALDCTALSKHELLLWMLEIKCHFPLVRVIALLARGHGGWEWLIRELGAVHVLVGTREVDTIFTFYKHHLASLPEPQLSLREWIWNRLPWPAASLPEP
jgi:hypothetical protein